jgi:hypothetical protein
MKTYALHIIFDGREIKMSKLTFCRKCQISAPLLEKRRISLDINGSSYSFAVTEIFYTESDSLIQAIAVIGPSNSTDILCLVEDLKKDPKWEKHNSKR